MQMWPKEYYSHHYNGSEIDLCHKYNQVKHKKGKSELFPLSELVRICPIL